MGTVLSGNVSTVWQVISPESQPVKCRTDTHILTNCQRPDGCSGKICQEGIICRMFPSVYLKPVTAGFTEKLNPATSNSFSDGVLTMTCGALIRFFILFHNISLGENEQLVWYDELK
jgi:hypothetical protein